MAVRYRHEHKAFYGTEYTTEIWDEDYSGDVVEFIMEGNTGFEQRMLGEGRELSLIHISEPTRPY